MKKLFLLLIVTLLASSCTCMLAQIPPQTIQINQNCQAILSDYTTTQYVIATDNCDVDRIVQTPAAGYVLNAVNQSVEVKLQAVDVFGNLSDEMKFTVTAIDTIKPVLNPQLSFLEANWDTIHKVYDIADKLVAEQEAFFDANFDWEAAGIPEDKRPIGQYDKKILSIMTSPGHAKTGYGSRVILFESNNDSHIVK